MTAPGAPGPQDVTGLLEAWQAGDESAFERAAAVVYPELHRIAAAYLARERRDHTLQPTALIHEAFMRLVHGKRLHFEGRRRFFALAARVMRQVLVDHARAVRAGRRGGGVPRVPLEEVRVAVVDQAPDDLLALHDALDRLASVDARKAAIIELRYFGGLSLEEVADLHGSSTSTVHRDQRFAEAWLKDALAS